MTVATPQTWMTVATPQTCMSVATPQTCMSVATPQTCMTVATPQTCMLVATVIHVCGVAIFLFSSPFCLSSPFFCVLQSMMLQVRMRVYVGLRHARVDTTDGPPRSLSSLRIRLEEDIVEVGTLVTLDRGRQFTA